MKKKGNVWKVLTIVSAVLLVLMIVANILGAIFQETINCALGTAASTTSTTGKGEVYFHSEFVKKNADGTVKTDAKGLEVYDDAALSAAADALVKDLHQLTLWFRARHPGLPLILFGHSMGSLAVRVYRQNYDGDIDGLVVCGSPGANPATGAGLLLKHACEEYGLAGEDGFLDRNEYGKPFFANRPGLHFSLSHSGDWAMCVLSPFTAGCDIEKIRPFHQAVPKRVFTGEERRLLSEEEKQGRGEKTFCRLWTFP